MTSEDAPSTPGERAEKLATMLRNQDGVTDVSASSDEDGAVVTCYAGAGRADEAERLAKSNGFDVGHRHLAEDEVYYVFGFARD